MQFFSNEYGGQRFESRVTSTTSSSPDGFPRLIKLRQGVSIRESVPPRSQTKHELVTSRTRAPTAPLAPGVRSYRFRQLNSSALESCTTRPSLPSMTRVPILRSSVLCPYSVPSDSPLGSSSDPFIQVS